MSILIHRCLKRSHLVQELYENWQVDHREAMVACDAEELCGEWLDLAKLCKHVWNGLLDALFEGRVADTEKVGEVFTDAVERTVKVGKKIQVLVLETLRRTFTINGSEGLTSELEAMESLESEIPVKWPFVNREKMAEALAAYGRGEYQGIEDILNAAQSRGSKELRLRSR